MIRQTFWLTGCDWAKGRRWTEQNVLCWRSSLSARGYRNSVFFLCTGSVLQEATPGCFTCLHSLPHPGTGQECLEHAALERRSWMAEQKANGFDLKCLPAENLFFGPSRNIWHLTYFAGCGANSRPVQAVLFCEHWVQSPCRAAGQKVSPELLQKRDSHLSFQRDTLQCCFQCMFVGACCAKMNLFYELVRCLCHFCSVFFFFVSQMPNTPNSPSVDLVTCGRSTEVWSRVASSPLF